LHSHDTRVGGPVQRAAGPGGPDGGFGAQAPGTLYAYLDSDGTAGYVQGDRRGEREALSDDDLASLADVPVADHGHEVSIDGRGEYRVMAFATTSGSTVF